MNRVRVVVGWSAVVCAVVVVSRFVFGDSWRTAVEYALISLVLTGLLFVTREVWWQAIDRRARRRQRAAGDDDPQSGGI